jgi:hypothetical protein
MTINAVYSKHSGKMIKFNYMEIFQILNSVCNLPGSHMHMFNVSIATAQGLKIVGIKV